MEAMKKGANRQKAEVMLNVQNSIFKKNAKRKIKNRKERSEESFKLTR